MITDEKLLKPISETIIGCAYKVANGLGCGFLEKVYENALVHELQKAGLSVAQQSAIPVYYDGIVVGDYFADLIVEESILIEIKAIRAIDEVHSAQCINYLAATRMPVCLLLNFRGKVEIKRFAGNSLDRDTAY